MYKKLLLLAIITQLVGYRSVEAMHEKVLLQEGCSPLHIAAATGDIAKAFELLSNLDKNALETTDNKGRTPLHLAASNGQSRLVGLLLAAGANQEAMDNKKNTALYYSINHSYFEVVKLLIDAQPS